MKENNGYFCIPLNIIVFETPVFFCPGINLKLKLVKNKDEFFLLSDGSKAKFRIDHMPNIKLEYKDTNMPCHTCNRWEDPMFDLNGAVDDGGMEDYGSD